MKRNLVIAALALAFAMPAWAGVFDDEEARARIEQLRKDHDGRLQKLEAAARGQLDLANQIEALKADLAKIRGQIEVLTFELEQAQKRQKDFYVDLDNRLRKLEQPPEKEPAAAAPPPPDPAAETREYEAALNLFKAAKYKEALAAFDAFVKNYANSSFVASAFYWSGQALYQLRDCRRAIEVYHKVSVAWPNDPKAPDAMLGLATCQQELNDAKNARITLEAIVAKYPISSAAQAARERLKRKK